MSSVWLLLGDCLERMKELDDCSVDAVVTDPPYGLGFMGKEWDTFDKSQFGRKGEEGENDLKVKKNFNVLPRYNTDGLYDFTKKWASECLRVLKPGGFLLSFAGTRTQHKIAMGIEDAGFEIRDMIAWVYGSGFPKSLNVGKAVDKLQGNEREDMGRNPAWRKGNGYGATTSTGWAKPQRPNKDKGTSEWEGWGTALKPSLEPITVARKPLSEKTVAENCLKWGTGGINIDQSRVKTEDNLNGGAYYGGERSDGDWKDNSGFKNNKLDEYKQPQGRFPANLIHDGSDEVVSLFPNTKSTVRISEDKDNLANTYSLGRTGTTPRGHNDSGSASRFFYCAKASKSERNKGLEGFEEVEVRGGGGRVADGYDLTDESQIGLKEAARKFGAVKAKKANIHPTVKPVKLMEYLVKLVSREGAVVLDPFMGSGSTGVACKNLNRDFIGVEMDEDYMRIAEKRINNGS
jgi:DNA modification methylase